MRFYRSRFAALPVLFVLSFAAVISIHLILTAPMTAQTTPDAQKTEAARLLNQGVQQYQTSHYREAVQLWEQALQLYQAIGDRNGEAKTRMGMGLAYDFLNQYDKAIESYQRALPIFQATGDRNSEAWAWVEIGLAYDSLSQYDKAIESYQRALPIFQATGNRNGEAAALNNLGFAYRSFGQYAKAIEFYQQALLIFQATSDRNGKANTQMNLGNAYSSLSQYDKAIEFYQQALPIFQATGDRNSEAKVLTNLGIAYQSLSQYAKAIEYYQQALPIFQATSDRNSEAKALANLGNAYQSLSQYAKAIESYQQASPIFQATGDRNSEASARMNLGLAYQSLSQYDKAIEYYQQALPVFQAIGDRNGEAKVLANLGFAYVSLSQYDKAIESYQQALPIFRATGDRNSEASARMNLGLAYQSLSQYDKAIEYYQQALPVFQAIGDRNGEAKVLANLGLAYQSLSQHDKAIEYYQQALPVFQAIGDRNGEAGVQINLGLAYQFLSQYDKAIESYQQALPILQSVGDRSGEAAALNNLGLAYLSLSQYDKAIECYQQALPILQATGDRDGQGTLLANIGKLLFARNQPQLAIIFFKQSVNVRESIRGDNRGLPKELQQSYTDSVAADYRQLADLLLQQNRVLEAQRVLDLLKVQELEDYLQNVSRSPQTQSGVEYWQPEQKIIELYKTAIDEGEELARLEEKAKSAPLSAAEQQRHDELAQRQSTVLTSFNQFIDRPEIQQAITLLTQTTQRQNIELDQLNSLQNNLRSLNQNAVLLYPLILGDRLELVLVTPDAPPIRRPVDVKAVDLNRAIVEMGQALKDPNSDVKPIAQKLYDWLIKPIEADLVATHAKTIIYAPDGALRYIPLAALYDSHQKEGEQWLIQRFAISHITAASLTDFDKPPSYRPTGNTGTPQLHVLAAACAQCNFNIQVNGQSYQFANLPYTEQEVNTLASEVPGTRTLLNRTFIPAIVSQMRQYNIIHLATHAAFVQGKPDDSFIVFGDGNSVPLSEIRNWNLPNTDLVVLSACETAVGEQQLGSGVEILGFGYQMQRAGARAAIASLWQVSDGGTQVLMNAFYTALEHGMTKAQALQQAQIALITHNLSGVGDQRGWVEVVNTRTGLPAQVSNNLSHPYYWAPFILIGNGL